jgi:hypothetical protein
MGCKEEKMAGMVTHILIWAFLIVVSITIPRNPRLVQHKGLVIQQPRVKYYVKGILPAASRV